MNGVRIIDKSGRFADQNAMAMDLALNNASVDILRLSKMQVPHDKGNLSSSGKYERKGLMSFFVSYNESGIAPYARRWEFETPKGGFKKGRKSRYLRDPAELIGSRANMTKLFKEAASRIRI